MRLDGVGKRYGIGLPWVVSDVSLDIGPGKLVRFEGRNGSGKSTLLRVIAGVSAPSRGTVTGRPATGYVPERFPPALPFPARDYLAHLGRVHGLAGQALDDRIEGCLELLGATEFAHVPLRTMSKGMCQKVAVAQALLPDPGLLVLDEAWTGLDVEAKGALDGAVAERLAEGGSVVFVDHDPRRLDRLAVERWQLAGGAATRVESDGDVTDGRDDGGVVVIDVIGGPDPARVTELEGVLSAAAGGDRLVVRAERAASDAVLRWLLHDGAAAHIAGVRTEDAR